MNTAREVYERHRVGRSLPSWNQLTETEKAMLSACDRKLAANATLVAAAPTLLSALQVARDAIAEDRRFVVESVTVGPKYDLATADEDGLAIIADYDALLGVIDAALAKAEAG